MAVRSWHRTSACGRVPPVARAIYWPFWGKRIANLTGLKFQELRDRDSLRLCGESVVLCNNRSVIARYSSLAPPRGSWFTQTHLMAHG